ncbi:MAG TPA: hypothetical protein VKQ06_09155 [Gammaproteobacteria bacterium]|nr:hypothetical protein [Gammaproteobacteria bacterium]
MFGEPRKIPVAQELQLLTDANTEIVSESEIVAKVEDETDAIAEAVARVEKELSERARLVTEDSSDKRVCYTIGPITDKARAIELSGRYSGKQVKTEIKSSLEKQYLGVMVYIGGHPSRQEAVKTANQLVKKGIHDHIIVDKADEENVLSLGVFGLKRNADRLKERVEKMDFDVETEARYRERTIFWLYGEQSSEQDIQRLLGEAEAGDGISQIPTQCLPT